MANLALSANATGDYYPTNYWQQWPVPYVQPTYIWPTTYVSQPTPRCAWCQGQHVDKCPNLKAVTYRPDGTVERVEFFGADD